MTTHFSRHDALCVEFLDTATIRADRNYDGVNSCIRYIGQYYFYMCVYT